MRAVIAAAQAALLVFLPFGAALTAQPTLSLVGGSEKVCQLTGENDWETTTPGSPHPTAAKTLTNFGLDGVDLGYPVENRGKLILLFGDARPSSPSGFDGEFGPNDAVGVTDRTVAPNGKDCLGLTINHTASPKPVFFPATITGSTPVKQGWFNVPTGGLSVGDALDAFFWTDHCAFPHKLFPSPNAPLVRPTLSPSPAPSQCPETDHRNSIGTGVLAESNDQGHFFTYITAMPIGFVYSIGINTRELAGLPDGQRLGVYILGLPRIGVSAPYLAYARPDSLHDPKAWRYFTGRGPDGEPTWVSYVAWRSGASGSPAPPASEWKPPGAAEITGPSSGAATLAAFSVTWNSALHSWLMLHTSGPFFPPAGSKEVRTIEAQIAPAVWGPWSKPITLLTADTSIECSLIMASTGCGQQRNYQGPRKCGSSCVRGSLYAPFVLDRYTTPGPADGTARSARIYWLVSTWNPYQVTVMRSTLELKP